MIAHQIHVIDDVDTPLCHVQQKTLLFNVDQTVFHDGTMNRPAKKNFRNYRHSKCVNKRWYLQIAREVVLHAIL